MKPLDIAIRYFKLSNESDFDEITKMFCEHSTFYSAKHELFLGVNDIMAMQRVHHGSYKQLQWKVKSVEEVKPGIIHFDFDFEGETQAGERIEYSGLEDVVIHAGKIQHIHVRLKDASRS
ncbi:hypothetical protein [Thalassomonas sp. RHCl1]|uniref:hypothetical protein n=1 Tax=Thalassomonas sp. RHCl1 TaxID=2995320 RepID=UPI00248CD4C4|nr:hypothetical protein [Thalassomonas sp. RHCl1]